MLVQNLAPGAAARLGLGVRRAVAEASAADRLRHFRLRRRRTVSPTRKPTTCSSRANRACCPSPAPRDAEQGRQLDRRHLRRHVRVLQHPRWRCCDARTSGTRRAHRRVDARDDGRMDGLSAVLRVRRAAAAAPHGRGPRDDLSRTGRFRAGDGKLVMFGSPERTRVGSCSATRCCSSRSSRAIRASTATRSAPQRARNSYA